MLSHFPFPHLERSLNEPWMMFVDGENLTIRGQKTAKNLGIELMEGPFYQKDTFLWFPGKSPSMVLNSLVETGGLPAPPPLQSHYYTSVVADDRGAQALSQRVRNAGFKPQIFKKGRKSEKSKGVDISIARDLLVHGFEGGFKFALLVAGDQDYLPLLEELQRRRLAVFVAFVEEGMGPRLRAQADFFFPLERLLEDSWDEYLFPRLGQQALNLVDGRMTVNFHGKRTDPDPKVYHSDVDHMRLKWREISCQLRASECVDRMIGEDDLRVLLKRLLATPSTEAEQRIGEAL